MLLNGKDPNLSRSDPSFYTSRWHCDLLWPRPNLWRRAWRLSSRTCCLSALAPLGPHLAPVYFGSVLLRADSVPMLLQFSPLALAPYRPLGVPYSNESGPPHPFTSKWVYVWASETHMFSDTHSEEISCTSGLMEHTSDSFRKVKINCSTNGATSISQTLKWLWAFGLQMCLQMLHFRRTVKHGIPAALTSQHSAVQKYTGCQIVKENDFSNYNQPSPKVWFYSPSASCRYRTKILNMHICGCLYINIYRD